MFCRNCGKEIPNNTNFCNHCGAAQNSSNTQNTQSYGKRQSAVLSQPVNTGSPSLSSKKSSTKKKVGIALVCLQILMLIGGISSGTILVMFLSGPAGIFEFLGYCIFGIIGIILIYKESKKEKEQNR